MRNTQEMIPGGKLNLHKDMQNTGKGNIRINVKDHIKEKIYIDISIFV